MENIKGYVGTYKNDGIFEFHFNGNQGVFTHHDLYLHIKETKYLSLTDGSLAGVCKVDKAGVMLYTNQLQYCESKEAHVACYITQDDRYLYTANYHDGNLIRYEKNQPHLMKVVEIQDKAGAHQVLFKAKEILVPCCLLDCIKIYDRNSLTFKEDILFPKGSGPRHGCLTKDEHILYMLSEHSCEIFCLDMRENKMIKKLSLLSEGQQGAAAAIRMSKDERFLYVSIRDINQLYVIDLHAWKLMQTIDCGGKHPRDMNISPEEQYVFVANRDSHNICAFQRDKAQGNLTYVSCLADIPEGVCIVFDNGGKTDEEK